MPVSIMNGKLGTALQVPRTPEVLRVSVFADFLVILRPNLTKMGWMMASHHAHMCAKFRKDRSMYKKFTPTEPRHRAPHGL